MGRSRSRSRSPRRDRDKDRDRERDRDRRDKGRRSRSRSPRGGRRDKDGRSSRKDDPRDKERDRRDDRSRRETTPPAGAATKALMEANPWVDDDEGGEFEIRAAVSNTAGEVSCSIEETNRIRALLGLKPLKLDNEEEEKKRREQRIKAAEEAKKERDTLMMAARIQDAKEKRMANAVFGNKTLADELAADEESAASWIEKSRKQEQERKEKEKELAAQRARALQEQEEEHERQRQAEAEAAAYLQRRGRRRVPAEGVGGVTGAIAADSTYTSRDLAGLKVAHDADAIEEGETVVLTLKDSKILGADGVNDEDDELENVRIAELEKRERAYKASKKTTTPYDDNEFNATFDPNDPASQAQTKNLLHKYDEVKAPAGFKLDEAGGADEATRARMESIRAKLAASQLPGRTAVALAPTAASMKQAADYYTNEELAAFRKPKKKVVKKIRKKGTGELVAELQKINEDVGGDEGAADLGSRRAKAESTAAREERERVERERRFERALGKANAVSKTLLEGSPTGEAAAGSPAPRTGGREKSELADEEEEAFDAELQKSLARARRIAAAAPPAASPPAAPAAFSSDGVFKVPPPRGPEAVVLAQLEAARRREAEAAEPKAEEEGNITFSDTSEFVRKLEIKQEYFEDDGGGRASTLPGGVSSVRGTASVRVAIPQARGDTEMAEAKAEESGGEEEQDEDTSFLEETPVAAGMAAALNLVKNRGYLNVGQDFGRGPDKTMKDLNKEEGMRLEYKDDFGNDMTPKEAFRWISWKFHGKMPGKMKQEKRLKKMQERAAVKKTEGSDAAAAAAEAFRRVQEATGQAHVVLTGTNALRPEQLAPAIVSKRKQQAAAGSSSAKKPK